MVKMVKGLSCLIHLLRGLLGPGCLLDLLGLLGLQGLFGLLGLLGLQGLFGSSWVFGDF